MAGLQMYELMVAKNCSISTVFITYKLLGTADDELRSGAASLFKKHFPPGNEVGLDTFGIVPDGEELKPVVVFDAEIVSECGDERLAFRIVVVKTEAEH